VFSLEGVDFWRLVLRSIIIITILICINCFENLFAELLATVGVGCISRSTPHMRNGYKTAYDTKGNNRNISTRCSLLQYDTVMAKNSWAARIPCAVVVGNLSLSTASEAAAIHGICSTSMPPASHSAMSYPTK
jgi:hypothetical protein